MYTNRLIQVVNKVKATSRKITQINNLKEKFSPGPGFEPGSPALLAGALTN